MVCDQPTSGYNLTLYLAPVEESQRSILYFMVPIFRWIGRAGGVPSSLLFVLSSRLLVWSLQVQLHHHTARLWGLFKSSRISVFFFVSVSIVSYLYGNDQNLNLTFSLHNSDSMNVFITQVFLQEFCDTQRTVPSAPLFTFSKGVPEDLKQESIATLPNVGFVTFSISYSFSTHVSSLVEEAYDVQELWVDCANHLLLQKLLELPLDDHQDVHAHRHEK